MEYEQIATYTKSKDVAWATINTPLKVDELTLFCRDIERLFRINPMLIFKKWQIIDAHRYRFLGQNISQEQPHDFDLVLTVSQIVNGIKIDYQEGIKTSTVVIIESADVNNDSFSRLTIIDNYDAESAPARKQQLHTVDKSIKVWAEHLQQYLYVWKRWSHITLWRWYMKNIWQPMKPAGRRITYILLWVTGLEVALILLGMLIYYLEYN